MDAPDIPQAGNRNLNRAIATTIVIPIVTLNLFQGPPTSDPPTGCSGVDAETSSA